MPVFQETSHSDRDLRIHSSRAPPLPRLTPFPRASTNNGTVERYEVVIIGAGPSGLLLTLLLARFGLPSTSLVCFDSKPGTLKAGQADGLQPRTLEVLKSLGLVDEILNEGCHMSEVAFWNPKENGAGITRTSFVPDVSVRCRFEHEVTIHQGRIERILDEDLGRYCKRGVVRSTTFVGFEIDSGGDAEFPLVVEVKSDDGKGTTETKKVRTKYLVGADGAHSQVRKAMGLKLEGETTDHIWGVCDFIADTDFPDVRKRSAIHSTAGSIMVIPREQISTGDYLTRLYVQIKDEVPPGTNSRECNTEAQEVKSRDRRAAITLDYIFKQAQRVLTPYQIKVKEGTVVDWWAAYQIGQRITPSFSIEDEKNEERVFIVGDACHTHSPKAGQGMNVSMMDSYNLAWKLAHTINGLTPGKESKESIDLLSTFSYERLTIAQQLIAFDTEFSSMFSGAIGAGSDTAANLTHEQFLKVFSDGNGFTSGCGIEYPPGLIVVPCEQDEEYPVNKNGDYLNGCLRPGRRLLDVKVKRFADANIRHLQDDFPSTGRYRILVLTSTDIHSRDGESAIALDYVCDQIITEFPASIIELVAVHPFKEQRFEWTDIPTCVKKHAEMKFHGVGAEDEVYDIYGVDQKAGVVVLVRPDGYIGVVTSLQRVQKVKEYLGRCLVRRSVADMDRAWEDCAR